MAPNNKTKATSSKTGPSPVKIPVNIVSPYKSTSKSKTNLPNPLEKKVKVHNIIPLHHPDKTPFGWAFDLFYDAKEFLKNLCNKKGDTTIFGNEEFKPFSNLNIHWMEDSALGKNLWIIHISTNTNNEGEAFPTRCHELYANKIARALLNQALWPKDKIQVDKSMIMDPTTESELTMIIEGRMRANSEINNCDFFQPGDSELESLI